MFDQAIAVLDQASALYDRAQPYLIAFLLLIIVVALAANAIANRGMPRVGGKIGRRTADVPAPPLPDGFSRVDCREITNFVAADDAEPYDSLKAFARGAVDHRPGLVHVYHVAGCSDPHRDPRATAHATSASTPPRRSRYCASCPIRASSTACT